MYNFTSSWLALSSWQHSLQSFCSFPKLNADSSSQELHKSVDEEKPNCKHASPLDTDASEIPKLSVAISNDNNGRRAIVSEDSLIVQTKKFNLSVAWMLKW